MKIIIYGIGSGRLRVEKYLKMEHEIIGYSDSFFSSKCFNKKNFYKPKELLDIKFDFIIIAIGDGAISNKVVKDLISYQIKKEKIIEFYKVYCYKFASELKKVNRVMQNTDKVFDGLILGISHGEVGINPQYLNKSFYNFALGRQDLFYNLKQLDELLKNYKDRIKNLKYVVLDMYTYTYFNYDVSRTKNAVTFLRANGWEFEETHNLKKSIEELKTIQENEEPLFNDLFKTAIINIKNDYEQTGYDLYSDFPSENGISKNLKNEEVENYKNQPVVYSGIQKNVFINTEKENIEIFDKLLKKLKQINSEIKIYIVLIPQHKVVEDKLKIIENDWKERFYKILSDFKRDYNFEILDFKNNEEISSKNNFYYDLEHLNYNGATAFTKLLNSYIFKNGT
ncbi:hypothetical protein HBE96_01915 [Clostridium sp. P21]|uniref:Uncharacterized protein n=1 Tax=Clostridium muellerianum TaxID=2716538 RepID=A0A7Y0EDL4_9CLOT|nr:hypothetical protein [Clostridium muellerianum]NMM61477.1 hypothetical protein [Clostridium muellerianum]